ncbi:nascent polypeptide-associated complex subunit alpha, muscle-specific form [Oncorhynchus kisutch]|uniref:nascent polypeptide-associated complex subunit alpha, muscle-specific form n=1 Tax=Oncorhynchus kisutch TaxID=8019 RepID=UPI0012DD2C81|nr:nascent polypeptide-associated complex subunit alpha, muscle-specific form [Oncorhynchus kisutch]
MDQEEDLDFKSLRAKFQYEEVLLKQPRTKPALPVKPKVLSPPHSPTNSLPSFSPTSHTRSNSRSLTPGARPSLLTSLQGKGDIAPRVIFKEKEKKVKGKDKNEGKVKLLGKKKAEADKEKSDREMNGGKDDVEDLLDQKQKTEADLVMKNKKVSLLSPRGFKGGSVDLEDVSPLPIYATVKKKGFRGIGKPVKSGKKGKDEFLPLPMLDIASPDMAGPEPLITLTTFRTPSPHANIPTPTALIPPAPAAHITLLPLAPKPAPVLDALLPSELLPSTLMPAPAAETITVATPPDPIPIPMIPDPPIVEPIPVALTLELETSAETIPAPTLSVLVPPSPTPSTVPALPSPVPTPPVTPNPSAIPTLPPPTIATPRRPAIARPPPPADPTPSPPPAPELVPEPESVVVDAAVVVEASASPPPSHTPLPPAVDPPVTPPSPQPESLVSVQERPLSALLALGRAEEMSPPKKRGTEIIFNALEKAKRKFGSPLTTPTIEDQPPLPHKSLPELPPIDYDDQAGAGPPTPLKPSLVNSVDVRQAFPVLDRIAGDVIPDLLEAPPPLSRRCLPEASTLRPLQEKPLRLPSMNLTAHAGEIPAPLEFSVAGPALDVPEFEDVGSELLKLEALEIQPADLVEIEGSEWGNGEYGDNIPETVLLKQEILEEGEGLPEFEDHRVPESEPVVEVPLGVRVEFIQETVPASPSSQDPQPEAGAETEDGTSESCDKANEDMPSAKQKVKGQLNKKKKEPKNPYTETQPPTKGTSRGGWSFKRPAPENPEEKDMKKKEKQYLEKEKKEQKEREKKEQKEREKKDNEMKKFKITGQEEAIYQATVTVASKGRKDDLAVKNRDIVSIIRTTNCPKGKWLARDSTNTYGYISLSQVELDIKEMLELGKKASHAISHKDSSTVVEQGGELARMGNRTSNHYPLQDDTGSFTDDSEEWTNDDDEPLSYPMEEDPTESGHIQTISMTGSREHSIHHQQTQNYTTIDGMDMQVKHEALQKLATFFHKPVVEEPIRRPEEPEPISPVEIEEPVYPCKVEADLELPDMMILSPPGPFADDNQ